MLKLKSWMMNLCQTACYVVSDESDEAVVIDPCAYKESERRRIVDYVEAEGLKPVRMLLTHGHFDHLLAADLIYVRYGLSPEVHSGEAPLLDTVRKRIDEVLGAQSYTRKIPMPEHWLSDGEKIMFGNHCLRVIHTPGHSPGSVFFYCMDENIAFSGDTLFRKSVGNCHLPFSSPEEMAKSLKFIIDTLPTNTMIYSGHTGKTTIGQEMEKNSFLKEILSTMKEM